MGAGEDASGTPFLQVSDDLAQASHSPGVIELSSVRTGEENPPQATADPVAGLPAAKRRPKLLSGPSRAWGAWARFKQ